MTKFILHGGVTSRPCASNDNFYKEIISSTGNPMKILLVYFAREKSRWNAIFENHKKLFLEKARHKKIKFTIASEKEKEFAKQAENNDVVFIPGGSTSMLQEKLEKIYNFKKLIEDKIVAGSSAGALVFTKYYYDQDCDKIFEGLGILPVKMITHYLSTGEYAATIGKDKVEKLKAYKEDLPIYAIPEAHYAILNPESTYQIIGDKVVGNKIFFSDRRLDEFRYPVRKIFKMLDGINMPNIKRKKDDCYHKAMAARYSLALIQKEILNRPSAEDMKNYSEMIAHGMCNYAELKNEVLIYETEAFLFQIRTNLDIIIQLLKYIPEYNYLEDKNKKGDNEALVFDNKYLEKNTTARMRAHNHEEMAKYFDKQIGAWIRKLNTKRNDIAHRSGLKGFASFVFESGTGKVIHPQMSDDGEDVDEYCSEVFDSLLSVYEKVFRDFILPKLKF